MGKVQIELNGKTILVTGSPGFIGANLVLRLLKEMTSGTVISMDNMNDYYDPALKEYRLGLIEEAAKGSPVGATKADTINAVEDLICDEMALELAFEGNRFGDLTRIARHKNRAALYGGNYGSEWLASLTG